MLSKPVGNKGAIAAAAQAQLHTGALPQPKAKPRPAAKPRPKPVQHPGTRPAPAPLAEAAKQYTGAFSGALNNISEQEQRVRDVAARRQADADKFAAWTLGKQGSLATQAAQADAAAQQQAGNIQAATAQFQGQTLGQLQTQRAAQGIEGDVPSQQFAPIASEDTRTQALLGSARTAMSDSAQTFQGRQGFLAAAANEQLLANKRAIAGDAFDQTSVLGREKTGIMVEKTKSAKDDKRAEQAAAASVAQAQIEAANDAADRQSRESIAAANIQLRQSEGESDRDFKARQGRANRKASLSRARISASAPDKVSQTEQRRRKNAVSDVQDTYSEASGLAKQLKNSKIKGQDGKPITLTPASLDAALRDEYPDMPKEARNLIVAQTFKPGKVGGVAGAVNNATDRTKKANAAYQRYLKQLAAGER